jgi:RHS repeat-associated protein
VPQNFLYNGKELQTDLGLNWEDYGARMYDPAISRWMSPDPLASKYYSISPYTYVANNPLKFIDPDGRKIIIFGERYGFLGLRRRRYEYHGNAEAPGGSSQFVKDSFKALNYSRGGDAHGIIDALAESEDKNVFVKRTGRANGFYNHNNNTIKWNPGLSVNTLDDDGHVTGQQPAALVLFHEVGHGYRHNFTPDEYFAGLAPGSDEQYGTAEERAVIEQYETPAASKLGHGTRTNHDAQLFPVNDPLSTTPLENDSPKKSSGRKPNYMMSNSPILNYIGSAGPADRPRKRENENEEK